MSGSRDREPAPLPLLFVGGAGRSGSTLLEQLVCDRPGYFGVGELIYIWERGCLYNERCSCGQPFRECPFWTGVLDHAFGGLAEVPAERILESQRYVLRMRHIPLLRFPWLQPPIFRQHVRLLHHAYSSLYSAIRHQAGAQVLVDSSKIAAFGYLIGSVPGVSVRVVHLVRDSRAVAHSWQRAKFRPEANQFRQYMPVFPPRTSAKIWIQDNTFNGGLRRHVDHGLLLRYEDLAADPEQVDQVLTELGLPSGVAISGDPATNRHSVSGNPSRMSAAPAHVSLDAAWTTRMTPRDRLVVTALTAPALLRYGYKLRH